MDNVQVLAAAFWPIFLCSHSSAQHTRLTPVLARPNVCVLASRDQLCIQPDVQRAESNSAKTVLCKQKITHQACKFFRGADMPPGTPQPSAVMDIEELVAFGQQHTLCPFYLARQSQTSADVIVIPYNYLIDPRTRRSQNLDIQNSVIIIDEAHNIEKACEESASFDLTPVVLANCVNEIDKVLASDATACDIQELGVLRITVLRLEEYLSTYKMKRGVCFLCVNVFY